MKKRMIAVLALAMILLFSATAFAQVAPDQQFGESKRFEVCGKDVPGKHKKEMVKCPPEIRELKEKFVKDNALLLQKIREEGRKLMMLRQKARDGVLSAEEQASLEKIQMIEKGLMAQKKAVKEICLALGEKPKAKEVKKAKEQIMQIQKTQRELLTQLLAELEKISMEG